MVSNEAEIDPPRKRIKAGSALDIVPRTNHRVKSPSTLTAPISPPCRGTPKASSRGCKSTDLDVVAGKNLASSTVRPRSIPSPVQLTAIKDLPNSSNLDTVSLEQLLGDPLIAECWEFNYLHDIDFLMNAFDPDVKSLVHVHVVHGFWKCEEAAGLQAQASRYPNVLLHTAYMPEIYGTHHTKMMVLLRHDDQAQIIIHTANMIERDWRNMTQAVWRSPLLPRAVSDDSSPDLSPGSGHRFKTDFLNYLKAYDTKKVICKPLIQQLKECDFSKVRGALVASVPGRHALDGEALWGWPALRNVLTSVPTSDDALSEVIAQVSSIATLGVTDQWLDKTMFNSFRVSKTSADDQSICRIIFPTADEIRRSLDGYSSGASIRLKIESGPQVKQLQYLKPLLHHWAGDGVHHAGWIPANSYAPADLMKANQLPDLQDAGRKRAAPHIKTYIRFSTATKREIEWVLVTSANLSKQAWGEAGNKAGDVRVSSYELGVLIWPALFGRDAVMVPTFKKDMPEVSDADPRVKAVVGFRMPYDLPLTKYAAGDMPWSATGSYEEPDWMGNTWDIHTGQQ